jgi:hypothetical protein
LNLYIKHILLDEFGCIGLFSEEQILAEELQGFDLYDESEKSTDHESIGTKKSPHLITYNPAVCGFGEFFVYASCCWTEHFGTVITRHLPRLDIERLCQVCSIPSDNSIKQNCCPQGTVKPNFLFDSSLYDPLGITSLYGLDSMLKYMLESLTFDTDRFFRDSAMKAAEQITKWGDLSRLKMLFHANKTSYQLRNFKFFQSIMQQWSTWNKQPTNISDGDHWSASDRHQWSTFDRTSEGWDLVFDLVDDVLDFMANELWDVVVV